MPQQNGKFTDVPKNDTRKRNNSNLIFNTSIVTLFTICVFLIEVGVGVRFPIQARCC